MFADIRKMGSDTSWCISSQVPVEIPSCDVLVAGCSCKSASSLNGRRSGFLLAFAKGDLEHAGTTGKTFQGLLSHVRRHMPAVVFMESVTGNLLQTKYGSVMASIGIFVHEMGYCLQWAILNTSEYILPQRRRRVWTWAYKSQPLLPS